MSKWIVYSKDGLTVRCSVRKLEYSAEFMGACSVTVSVSSPTPVQFSIGDYIEYRGERFELNYDPSVIKQSSYDTYGEGFTYDDVKFNSLSDELTRCEFLDYVDSDNLLHYSSLPNFSFFADSVSKLAERIRVNLDRVYTGSKAWTVVVHEDAVITKNANISVSSINCWEALALVKEYFDANFIIRGRTITIGTAGIAVSKVFGYGKGNGLLSVEKNTEQDQAIVTRLRAYGSTRNMPAGYYRKYSENVPNNMAVMNLMLPSFPDVSLDPYIDSANVSELGVREGTVFFDGSGDTEEIYPSMEGMTAEKLIAAGIPTTATGDLDVIYAAEQITDDGIFEPEEGEESVEIPSFTITLKDIGFDINDYLSTSNAVISMKDGMCGGREFEIVSCEKDENNRYVLTCNRSEDAGLGLFFPYKDYQIKAGDKFVLLNIEMPDVYVKVASQRLLEAATAWLAKNDYVHYSYTPTIDNIWMQREHDEAVKGGYASIHDTIKEGDLLLFEDSDLGIDGSIIIDQLTIKEDSDDSIIPQYEITLRNDKAVGTFDKIQNQIDSIASGCQGGGYNAQQIQSLIKAYGDKVFLRKDKNDTAHGVITFMKGLRTGEYTHGLLGTGAQIDELGQAELHSLFVRTFLEVPEIRYNRVTVRMGDEINSCAAGIIESVSPLTDRTGTLVLKLEDGEFGSLMVDDIVFQIFSDMENPSNNAVESSDDGKGNRFMKGFATVMFKVTGVSGDRNENISYELRYEEGKWETLIHPFQFGTFAQRGNFTNTERQTIIYQGIFPNAYTRYLFGVNDWEFTASMIGMQLGDLSNLSVFGYDFTGYSAYLNNVYFTGMIRQMYIPEWIEGESSAQNGTIVYMGGNHYVSKGDTDVPPLFGLLDEEGNQLQFSDGEDTGDIYDENNEDYDHIAKDGKDGVGIQSTTTHYLLSADSTKPSENDERWGTALVEPTDLKPYLWKKTTVTYSNLTKQVAIECISVRGKDGTSVNIKGAFDSESELIAAFPNGPANSSDAYIVNGNLYVWTGASWKNVGQIQGEKGDTAYVHIKYANETSSGTTVIVNGVSVILSFTGNDGEDTGDWMGVYTDHIQADSMNIADYKWKNIKGSAGADSTSYWLDSPVGNVTISNAGYANPGSFTVTCKKKAGSGEVINCSEFYLAAWRYASGWELVKASSVKSATITLVPVNSSAYRQYRVTAHTVIPTDSSTPIVCELGIGVSFDGQKGADGADGSDGTDALTTFTFDRGFYAEDTAYYYKEMDGIIRRDKILYEIGGAYYNFLVRTMTDESSSGLVNTPPTSASGDANWEVMSQFRSLIADTLFGNNANIGGFMASAEKMRSQSQTSEGNPLFELNGSNGTMTMRQSGGTVWKVDESGLQSVGNSEGERIEINPNTRSVSSYDKNGVERTVIDGTEYAVSELVSMEGGTVSLNANAQNTDGYSVTGFGMSPVTETTAISNRFYASVGVLDVSISSMKIELSYPVYKATVTSEEIQMIPFGEVILYVDTFETESSPVLVSRKVVGVVSVLGEYGAVVSEDVFSQHPSVPIGKGYHQLTAVVAVQGANDKMGAVATGSWAVSGATVSVESYVSRHFANGMFLSCSSSEYFMAMSENSKMNVQVASGGNVYSIRDGGLKINGISQPMTIYAARVTDTSDSSSVSPTKVEIINNGVYATLTKLSSTGEYKLSFPSSYGLTSSNMIVNLTGYGFAAAEDSDIKATLKSISITATSCDLFINTSDDSTRNYGGFMIEIKKII